MIFRGVRFIFRRIVFGPKATSKGYIKHLKRKGVSIGTGTIFHNPTTVLIDETSPYMLFIGKNCQITGGVSILTHDYGWAATKAVYGDVLGSVRKVEIGDNVYIWMNATIIAGASIGNNVVIGANSLVSGKIPDNCVCVGNPARVLYSLEKYHERRKTKQIEEAFEIVKYYYRAYGYYPPKEELSEHFWLFESKKENLPQVFVNQNNLMPGSESQTWRNFISHAKEWENYEEFLKYCKTRLNNENK